MLVFISNNTANIIPNPPQPPGSAVVIALEGSRAICAEIQSLVSRSSGGSGGGGFVRRTVDGVSNNRVALILAVLTKRLGLSFSSREVFVNVAGGIKFDKRATSGGRTQGGEDVATAVSLVSSLAGIPVRADTCFVGEVGLSGEVRAVGGVEKRIKEAGRMGFSRVVVPSEYANGSHGGKRRRVGSEKSRREVEVVECGNLLDCINAGLVRKLPKREDRRTKVKLANDDFDKNKLNVADLGLEGDEGEDEGEET